MAVPARVATPEVKREDTPEVPEAPKEEPRSLYDEHSKARIENQRKEILHDQVKKQLAEEDKILEAVRTGLLFYKLIIITIKFLIRIYIIFNF